MTLVIPSLENNFQFMNWVFLCEEGDIGMQKYTRTMSWQQVKIPLNDQNSQLIFQ